MRPYPSSKHSAGPLYEEGFEATLLAHFQDPPASLRGKPFWSWNGQLEESELLRQIDVAKEMGMGGAFMHSRTGLKSQYLGDEWFKLINSCAQKCADEGLEGWIYDEDRWPSGTAGGMVTQAPEHRMRSIVLEVYDEGQLIEWPEEVDFIEAHRAVVDGLSIDTYEPIAYHSQERSPAGAKILLFVREVHPSNSFYNGGAYLDTLSREATDAYIESTHEKYREHCESHFGKSIKGVFTDEPHRGFILCDAVQQPGATRPAFSIPFTEGLFEAFESDFGVPLAGSLPELFYRYRGAVLSKLKWQYVELLQRLFIENWALPCADWCERHDLLLTGHVLHEDSLAAQVVPVGSLFRYYETMSYPGIDVLSKRCEAFWVAKQVVSSARQLGKPFVLSELYGCTGWDMGFDGHKRIGDWQAFQGVNLRCHHLSWYSMAGESKRDYPASIFHQSAWYPEYKYVEDYFSRINHLLSQGEPDCDVLVVHPGESLWAQFHLGWAKWLGSDSPDIDVIEANYATLYSWLMNAQVDFDYGDEEQMDRLGSIEVVDDEVFFRLGKMRYRSIVVGGMDTMRASTLAALQAFSAAGGSVVFAGACPTHVDAEPSNLPLQFAGEIGSAAWNRDAVLSAVRKVSRQVLLLNDGKSVDGVISHVRLMDNGDLLVALVNTTEAPIDVVSIRLPAVGSVEQWNCRDGSVEAIDAVSSADGLSWQLGFESLQEHVFRVRVNYEFDQVIGSECTEQTNAPQPLSVDTQFDYELSEPNAWVMDRPRYRVGAGEWCESEDILRIDDLLRQQLDWELRTGTMVQPWCDDEAPKQGPGITLEYSFQVSQIPELVDLLIEQPDRWEVSLNGSAITLPNDPEWFIDIALKRISLPMEHFVEGCNRLTLKTRLRADTDLEAIYLLGDFGVFNRGNGYTIEALPETLVVGDLVHQGLPFYTGRVSYLTALTDGPVGADLLCELPQFAAACGRVSVGDVGSVLAFPPYRVHLSTPSHQQSLRIDLTLTRQNLFGPFHRLPKGDIMTAPSSFRTEGVNFSADYELFPSGLLKPPAVCWLTD